MSERNSTSDRLTYLLIGAGIGATLALLFAPKSGKELRRDIADAGRKTYGKSKELAHQVSEKVSDGVGSVRETIERQKSSSPASMQNRHTEERHRESCPRPGGVSAMSTFEAVLAGAIIIAAALPVVVCTSSTASSPAWRIGRTGCSSSWAGSRT
jgi:gas vesicle protein